MSYSIDANLLLYASNTEAPEHPKALAFLERCDRDTDLLCMTWPVIMAYLRISTHPAIFQHPLHPDAAWANIERLLARPRTLVLGEGEGFATAYREAALLVHARGNLVPDTHIAAILRQNGVKRMYSADTDFRKFPFLDVINPLATSPN